MKRVLTILAVAFSLNAMGQITTSVAKEPIEIAEFKKSGFTFISVYSLANFPNTVVFQIRNSRYRYITDFFDFSAKKGDLTDIKTAILSVIDSEKEKDLTISIPCFGNVTRLHVSTYGRRMITLRVGEDYIDLYRNDLRELLNQF